MIIHNLKLAIRQLLKYKLQTLLSLVGLAIGFTCFALSSLWWRYETTYDAFHPDADNLYIQVTSSDNWARVSYLSDFGAATLAMKKVPQVEQATSFLRNPIRANDVAVWYCMVDSLFLSVFQPELIAGNYPQMHPDEMSVVLTDKAAKKLFGTTDCIGREVNMESSPANPEYFTGTLWENGTYTVAAVVKDWGNHSTFFFDCLIPFKSAQIAEWIEESSPFGGYNILRMHPTADADTVSAIINKVQPIYFKEAKVVRLSSLRTEFPQLFYNLVKIEHIRTFALLGLVVVVCAVFNYLSLYTIRIRMRARELALRLVCGSSRGQLLILLLTEFIILLIAACILGIMFLELTLPEFKEITHIKEDTSFFFSEMGLYILGVALGTMPLLVGVIWWVQRQSLNETLHKGMVTVHRNLFRPFSQWLQLAVCMGLVFFTSVIVLQLHYLRTNTVTGFIHENRAIYRNYGFPELMEEVTHYLQSHPDVEEIKVGCQAADECNYRTVSRDRNGNRVETNGKMITRDEAEFWGLELLAGRWMEDYEQGVVMLNESAVRYYNLDHPIDTVLSLFFEENYRIVGIVRNVSSKSLIVPQEPVVYIPKEGSEEKRLREQVLSFSYRPGSWPALRDSLNKHYSDKVFYIEPFNVDEEFNRLLHSEDTLLGLFYVMTSVCVLIALFGVYSLITISCEQRRKEIAVRKVYGATVGDILRLFFGEQLVVLLASALVGFPIAYVCVKPWLEGYIHQVDIPLWLCPAIFLMVALLVALCIGWRVWRTAKARPADEIE